MSKDEKARREPHRCRERHCRWGLGQCKGPVVCLRSSEEVIGTGVGRRKSRRGRVRRPPSPPWADEAGTAQGVKGACPEPPSCK